MKCGLRSQVAGVKSRPSGDMEVIIKNVPWLRSMNRQGEKSFDGRAPLAFPLWPSRPATTGWAEGGPLSQWWGKTKGVLHRVKYPFCLDWLPGQDSNLRPAGYKCPSFSTGLGLSLHPPTESQGRVSGAVEALLDGFRSL